MTALRSPLAAFALLAASCAPLPARNHAECPDRPPADAAAFDSSRAEELVGDYDLIAVTTARGYRGRVGRGRLRLVVNDTLHRYDVPGLGRWRRYGERPLVGTYVTAARSFRDTVEVEGRTLYVGCRRCFDGSPTHYVIRAVGPRGFWGTWENFQTGLVHAVDDRGAPLPNPSGHYCALRRPRSE